MSILGAMNTADSGLTAQSAAFTNISDNIANSQTVGYKAVTTSFSDYLTSSTAAENMSGAVTTTPQYENDVQGTITASSDPLALAISGQGFFAVSEATGTGGSTFNDTQYYTRAGDFTQNTLGYLVNGSGEYLDGYNVNPSTGQIDGSTLAPIQVNESDLPAEATSNLTYSATLPTTAAAGTVGSATASVYDAAGTSHAIDLNWTSNGTPDQYTLTMTAPDSSTALGSATVTFNADGTLASVTPTAPAAGGSATAGQAAAITISPNFTGTAQPITLSLGTIGSSSGLSMAGDAYSETSLNADGQAVGHFTGVSMTSSGDVVASYDNSQTRTIATIPLAMFTAPDALQRQDGQAFTATAGSGAATLANPNENGAGTLVTQSVESSNTDISTDLTRLISAQQAYGANAKMITTADQMMQTAIQMVQ